MSIRAQLTIITTEAQSEANNIYDKFRSKELAILNENYADQLEHDKRDEIMASYNLSEIDLSSIIDEYLHHQGMGRVNK
ncbi:MAG: hypothetical protein COA73_03075 [Candidatus Hydrogenedentota bacterium]|nr:MAG: hypothetical protein COA73_03075 [Candidatus Hydrogenedentota bacterium]